MLAPPKDRHFLVNNYTYHWRKYHWVHVGCEWKEAYWDGEKFRIWAGKEGSMTTEHCAFKEWAELPGRIFTQAEVVQEVT